jgi:hypothetical protein
MMPFEQNKRKSKTLVLVGHIIELHKSKIELSIQQERMEMMPTMAALATSLSLCDPFLLAPSGGGIFCVQLSGVCSIHRRMLITDTFQKVHTLWMACVRGTSTR